ncbi:hypothetical protein NRB16_04000 [Pseudomonas sp. LJDD11]|uniref:hypothetical protein n=1 Tax=Pseudomonas sp. LJDD11 TaxID=2931984 RepID=UPI00211BEC4F|nr:hypothetical protein [Pseudomonas sp. LJDD11]MCQ9422694.1 hypothetical protein [Pseudomonas sp. LJDD11]
MTEFQREDRYIVVKLKHLRSAQGAPFPDNKIHGLLNYLSATGVSPIEDAVVIEADWPEHEPARRMIERRMTGQPPALDREVHRWQLKGFIPGIEGVSKAMLRPWVVMADDFDAHVAKLQTDLINMREERDIFRRKIDNFDKTIAGVPALARAEKLQAEVKRLQAITSTSMGVGNGSGQLIVHGDYDSIKAAQRILWERDDLKTLIDNVRHVFSDNVDVREHIDGLLANRAGQES